ncbi:hypothetical protein TNCV_2235431 [Trichonephila clavipes]|nr:hypothetical protein TNCV_2235431 [Trichonephila clavipes]
MMEKYGIYLIMYVIDWIWHTWQLDLTWKFRSIQALRSPDHQTCVFFLRDNLTEMVNKAALTTQTVFVDCLVAACTSEASCCWDMCTQTFFVLFKSALTNIC